MVEGDLQEPLDTEPGKLFLDLEDLPCQCFAGQENCVCGREEKILRAYSRGTSLRLMTPAERYWCVREADKAGEGAYNAAWLAGLDDQELARVVLQAWKEYVDSHF